MKLAAALNRGVQLPSPPPVPPTQPITLPIHNPSGIMKQAVKGVVAPAVEAATGPLSPADQAALNDALAPFVDLGLRLAAG